MGNGALAGLVAITAGCSTVYPWGAIVIGLLAGPNYCVGSWVSTKLHVSPATSAGTAAPGCCLCVIRTPHMPTLMLPSCAYQPYCSSGKAQGPAVEGHCLESVFALQLDDPLDAIAVHAWNGSWGAHHFTTHLLPCSAYAFQLRCSSHLLPVCAGAC